MGATTQNSLPWREIAGFSWAANSSTLRRSGLDKAPNATLPLLELPSSAALHRTGSNIHIYTSGLTLVMCDVHFLVTKKFRFHRYESYFFRKP